MQESIHVHTTVSNLVDQRSARPCLICERDVLNPCAQDEVSSLGDFVLTQEVIIPEADVIRAKTLEEVQRGFFCELGRWLATKNLSLPEIRWMVAYALYGALEKGVRLERPDGTEYVIAPETVDEVFDGREAIHLPVTDDWSDEPVAYDRAIREWLDRAVSGQITSKPERRWGEKLRLLDLARRVLNSNRFNET